MQLLYQDGALSTLKPGFTCFHLSSTSECFHQLFVPLVQAQPLRPPPASCWMTALDTQTNMGRVVGRYAALTTTLAKRVLQGPPVSLQAAVQVLQVRPQR